MIAYLTLEDVLALLDDLKVGPSRDVGLLDSAVPPPQATVFRADAYSRLGHVSGRATLQQWRR